MKEYRNDIDGLRALAVVAVICFHINPRLVSGGFVGVDVFFVISGFLITQIICYELKRPEFSILNFYQKRVARLFPALFLMFLSSVIATYFISHPTETQFFGKSLIASIFYVSNIFYLNEASYFSADPRLNPLLHTWSLAVEEQFYLLYPVLLILIHKFFKNKTIFFLIGIGIGSFLLNLQLVQSNEAAAFYLSPSRFYQLMAGGILALALKKPNRIFSELSVIMGLLVIIISIFIFSEKDIYPGVNALLPTLGAILILLGGHNSAVSDLVLSNYISKLIGKISYSLYLWHWPIIVFYKIGLNPTPKRAEQILLVVITFVISYLSWKLVENPLRKKGKLLTKKEIFSKAFVASIIGLIIGCGFIFSEGLRYRYSTETLYFAEYKDTYRPSTIRKGTCFLISFNKDLESFTEENCIITAPDKKNILLLGDSHITRFYYPMRDNLPEATISQVTSSGCRPTISKYGSSLCIRLMHEAFENYIPKYQFDVVILFAYWKEYDVDYLIETVEQISKHAKQVIVLGPMVTYDQSLPRLLARFMIDDKESVIFQNARNYSENLKLDHRMRDGLAASAVEYVSLLDLTCPNGVCKTITAKGEPIQIDYGHLTYAGGSELVRLMINKGIF